MVTDDIQQLKTELAGLVREQADRVALHQQKAAAINAEAQEYMEKQAKSAERYLEHRRELGLREAAPEEDKEEDEDEIEDGVDELDFEPEEEETDPPVAYDAPAPAVPPPPAFEPPAPARGRTPERAPRRAARRPVEDEDDDDAFLNLGWRE